MREVSQSLRGVPSGFVASQAIAAVQPVAARTFSASSRIETSRPEPTFAQSGGFH